ncbi:MAG TPA: hypothetical protein VF147_16655 [Vicinamibacterales bacterium]
MKKATAYAAMLMAAILVTTVSGQEAPARPAEARGDKHGGPPVKLQLVLSRMQGEKKMSSTPYVFWLKSDGFKSNLRMGNQIPIPDGKGSYAYRDVGTNIDASAFPSGDGGFDVNIIVNDSSVYFPDRNDPAAAAPANTGIPAFRSFTSNFKIELRDGQSGQYLSATDQVTGQVTKLDATLTVLK